MIDKIVERITLTKEDIHGMINDVMEENGASSNPKGQFIKFTYNGESKEQLQKYFGKFLSNIRELNPREYTANINLEKLKQAFAADSKYKAQVTWDSFSRSYIMYGSTKNQLSLYETPLEVDTVLSTLSGDEKPVNENPFGSLKDFENFIIKTYAPGQRINGLDTFYNSVVNNSRYRELILNPPAKSLQTDTYPISGTEKELYNIINKDIRIPNGDPSELWFAIVFKGLVVGARGKTPDVEVGSQTVSLKNYSVITFDFGTLDTESKKILSSLVRLSFLLTENPIDPGQKSRGDINDTLQAFESDELKKQVKDILELGETTTIPSIKKLSQEVESLINSDDPNDLHNLSVKLCNNINDILKRKIFAADWWGLIIASENPTLFLESASSVYEHTECVNNRLPESIANFKADHLWINASKLGTKVTASKRKS